MIAARHGTIQEFAIDQIAKRRGKRDESELLFDLYKANEQKPDKMKETGVFLMLTSDIFAGSDTTAISLRSIIYVYQRT